MAKAKARTQRNVPPPEHVMSIVGQGMKVVGDCVTTDTVRIEGVVEGSVHADKAVVIGKDGRVTGDVLTQDAVIAGAVAGAVHVHSRLELQSTCKIDGEIKAARLKLDEGGIVNGTVAVGRAQQAAQPDAQGGPGSPGQPGPQGQPGLPGQPVVAEQDGKRGARK